MGSGASALLANSTMTKLGLFSESLHPRTCACAIVLCEDREAVVLPDRLAYREDFIGEHLVDSAETMASSLAFIGGLADEWLQGDHSGTMRLTPMRRSRSAAHASVAEDMERRLRGPGATAPCT